MNKLKLEQYMLSELNNNQGTILNDKFECTYINAERNAVYFTDPCDIQTTLNGIKPKITNLIKVVQKTLKSKNKQFFYYVDTVKVAGKNLVVTRLTNGKEVLYIDDTYLQFFDKDKVVYLKLTYKKTNCIAIYEKTIDSVKLSAVIACLNVTKKPNA